jgi:hypothetical protein
MSAIVHRVANMAGASVVNVVAFGAGAAVHTTVVSALLSRAQLGGMNLLILVLCLVSTLVAFVILFPLMSLTNIVGMSSAGRGAHALRDGGRLAGRYAMTRRAAADGGRDADLVGSSTDERQGGDVDPLRATGQSRRLRRISLPAEGFGRPEQSAERREVPGAAGTPIGRGPIPVAALSAGQAERTRGSLTSSLVPLEGVVIEHPPSLIPETTVVHDAETIIASDGVGPRLFDPATKSSVRTDLRGNVIEKDGVQ